MADVIRGLETGLEAIQIIEFDELDSTNSEARRRAEGGETGPLWILAHRQSAGRGRRGRAWQTASGNLAATLLVTTSIPPAEAAQASMVMAFAVRHLARTYVPATLLQFKWPNDVMLAGEKLSGILIESGVHVSSGELWMAIGVGVNLREAPTDVERPATCLASHLKADIVAPPSPREALEVLSVAAAKRLSAWTRAGLAPFHEVWLENAMGIGQRCQVRLTDQTLEGIAEGLDPDGALRLRLDGGAVTRITAGDVFFGEA